MINMKFEKKSNKIPVLYLQPDWYLSLSEPNGKAWVSCKYKDEPGVYGTIERDIISEGSSAFKITDDFLIEKSGANFMLIRHKKSNFSTCFLKPKKCLSTLHTKSVTSMSITPKGVGVSAGLDESLLLWNTEKNVKRKLTGHVGEVYKCRFFPSGEVVFSAGSDMSLKIWCARTGLCPVTLVGHTMAVTDLAFVDRGKNVLSCSKDGYLKLWNCADSSCIYNIVKLPSAINCCSVNVASPLVELGVPTHEISPKEVNTDDKVVLVGCEDGTAHYIALKSHKKLFSIDTGSAINCLTFITNNDFVIGCQDGSIYHYNIEFLKEPDICWTESNSAVLSLFSYNNNGFFSSRADGSVEFRYIRSSPLLKISLCGSDCDPVYDIATDGSDIYTCCRDSKIRRYHVADFIEEFQNL